MEQVPEGLGELRNPARAVRREPVPHDVLGHDARNQEVEQIIAPPLSFRRLTS